MRKINFFGVSLLAISSMNAAFAQNAPAATPAPIAAKDVPSDEIIVTATKRAKTLLDTPVSVSVTSADTIQKAQIRDLLDLQTIVPSLRVEQLQSSANTNFIIRGFGNGANNYGIEPSVGVFIDGVYRSRSAAQIGDLPNLQRIEVLRGPQSILFGKNASAGVISIITQAPQFKLAGNAELSYGRYNAIVGKAYVTGPLSDKVAVSLSGSYNHRDGYAKDLNLGVKFNDRNRYGIGAQVLFKPTDDFKLRLIADYNNINENCCIAANIAPSNPALGQFATPALLATGGLIASGQPFSYNVFNNFKSVNKLKNYGVSLQADYNFDKVALSSITAYRKLNSNTNQDSDFTSADLIGENRALTKVGTFTQELRVTSNLDGPINFLLGGFFFNEKIKINDDLLLGKDFRGYAGGLIRPDLIGKVPGSFVVSGLEANLAPFGVTPGSFFAAGQGRFDNYDYNNTSASVFGDIDFKPTDKLTLTVGLNYTNDRKREVTNNTSTDVFSSLDLVQIGVPIVTQGAIASTVGKLLGLPGSATAAQVGAFAAANPAGYGQVAAGSQAFALSPAGLAANPLLGLRPFQFLPQFLNLPNAVESGRTKDTNLSYTVRAAYAISPHLSTYVTYATGFKASSINLSTDSRPSAADFIAGSPVTNPPSSAIRIAGLALPNLTSGTRFALPEKARTIELGVKGQFPGVRFDLAIFKQTLKNFQGNLFIGGGFVLSNAGQQSSTGFEFEGTLTPVKALNVNFALTYLKPKYDSYTNSPNGDLTGLTPAGIPAYSLSLGGSYTHEVSDSINVTFATDFNLVSKTRILDNPTNTPLGSYSREQEDLNASITFALNRGIEVAFWGRNILNNQYLVTIFPSVAQGGSISGYPSQPVTYGATVRYKF